MLPAQRHAAILAELERDGAVRVSDLVTLLGVSDMTIRRDLDALSQQGFLVKIHGGATIIREGSSREPAFEMKASLARGDKYAIAREAVKMVRPGNAIALTAGTTTYLLATLLADIPNLTIVTNSIRAAETLWAHHGPGSSVVLTGGERTPSEALVGPVTVEMVSRLHVDLLFMGVHGISETAGFTTPNLLEAQTNSAMVRAASHVVVLADHSKWGMVGLSSMATLEEVHTLITDDGMSSDALSVLRAQVPDVRVVAGSSAVPAASHLASA